MYDIPYYLLYNFCEECQCVRKVCTGFGKPIFIPIVMQQQKLQLWIWVLISESNDNCPHCDTTIQFLLTTPRTFCTCRQERKIKAQSSCWTVCLSCGLLVWCSIWRSLSFCVLGHRLEQTVELLCLPTDISELPLLCLGRLLQYTEESGRNSYSATHEKMSSSPKL